jgi:hypothetical protein
MTTPLCFSTEPGITPMLPSFLCNIGVYTGCFIVPPDNLF